MFKDRIGCLRMELTPMGTEEFSIITKKTSYDNWHKNSGFKNFEKALTTSRGLYDK